MAEIVQLWPDDAAARNQDAYLRLLLRQLPDGAAEAAERQAQIFVAQEPWNWSARATLGLARLRLGRKEDALAVFRTVRATGSEPPGALAVRAAILAVNGYEEGARGDAPNPGTEHLCPKNELSSLRCCRKDSRGWAVVAGIGDPGRLSTVQIPIDPGEAFLSISKLCDCWLKS